jgi:predicted nucleotidyltransferase/uncharacterized protein with HEPN domain
MLTLEQIQSAVNEIAGNCGLQKATLVGDYADGIATEDSAVELLLAFEKDGFSLLLLGEIKGKLEDILRKMVWVYEAPVLRESNIFARINKERVVYDNQNRITKEQIQAALDTVCPKHGATKWTLFGSYAHSTATEDSDVDVLITLPDGLNSFDAKFRIGMELEEVLGIYADVLVAPLSPNTIFVLDENGVPIYMEGAERDQRLIPYIVRDIAELRMLLHGKSAHEYLRDIVLQKAVSMSIVEVAEKIKGLSKDFLAAHSDDHFKEIVKTRNVLVHKYGVDDDGQELKIDYNRVWILIHEVLFPLESQLAEVGGCNVYQRTNPSDD